MAPSDRGWIIVSGAGGALGSAIAFHYARAGRLVLGLDRADGLTVGNELPPSLVMHSLELTSMANLEALFDEVISRAPISLVVNAVGAIWNEPILAVRAARLVTHELESWHNVLNANLTAPFVVGTVAAARMAHTGGGSIVNFSSISSSGNPGQTAYAAAKAGIEGMTRTMAAELGPLGIRVNAVSLGFIDTATTRAAVPESKLLTYIERTPLGCLGTVDDVIRAIEFLATEKFVTGVILPVNGGLRL